MAAAARKNEVKNLQFPPRTVYLSDETWDWITKHAQQIVGPSVPGKTATAVRIILDKYVAENTRKTIGPFVNKENDEKISKGLLLTESRIL